MVGRRVAGLFDFGIEAEVGGQLAAILEAADVADGGHEGRRDGDVDAGDGHQPLDLRPGQRVDGDELLDRGDLRVEEVDLAQPGVDGLALADRQLLLAQPAPALTPNRSDAGARSFRRRISTAWISFLTRERARTSCARRARRRRIVLMRSSGVQTPSSSRPRAAWPAPWRRGGRSSLGPGGCRCRSARRRSPVRRAPRGSRRSPRVAGHLQRHPVTRIEALREQLQRVGPSLDPARRPQPALRHDRDLAEVAMNIHSDRSHLALLIVDDSRRTGGQTTSTDPRSQRNRASRRGGH